MRVVFAGCVAALSIACVELPEGFADATPIEVVQHDCAGSPDEEDAPVSRLMAARTSDNDVSGTLLAASFVCSTEVCGYAVEVDGVARVLFQPCDMHPFTEALCVCRSDIDFVAPFAADVALDGAEAWRRDAHVEQPAVLVDGVDF